MSRAMKRITNPGDMMKVKVKERHSSLNKMIEDLPVLLSDVSSSVDREFLAAYKAHVVEVQSELRSLKHQVTLAETQLNDDTTVASLEAEVKWLTDEVTRLRLNSQSMKKDLVHILDRINILNDQKAFLGDRLKQVLKRNRVLEAEIGQSSVVLGKAYETMERGRTVNPDELSEQEELIVERSDDEGEGIGEMGGDEDYDYNNDGGGGYNAEPYKFDDEQEDNYGGLYGDPQVAELEAAATTATAAAGAKPVSRQNHQRRKLKKKEDEMVDRLLHAPRAESPNKDKVKAAAYGPGSAVSKLDELFAARSPEEVIFEKEVERVFRQIVARMIEQSADKQSTTRPNTSSATAQEEYFLTQAKKLGGVSGLGLENFSDTDRFATIINFLDNPEVFEKIVQVLATNYVQVPGKQS